MFTAMIYSFFDVSVYLYLQKKKSQEYDLLSKTYPFPLKLLKNISSKHTFSVTTLDF